MDVTKEFNHLREVVARNVKYWRVKKNISQNNLCYIAGIGFNQVYKIEAQFKTFPSTFNTYLKIAKALDISVFDLFKEAMPDDAVEVFSKVTGSSRKNLPDLSEYQ